MQSDPMTLRRNYAEDPTLGDQVFALLEVVFPGVGSGRRNGDGFGVSWESISTPFVVVDHGAVVAHVGLAHGLRGRARGGDRSGSSRTRTAPVAAS